MPFKPLEFQKVALILLAAGEARRFGGAKLLAPLRGRPLIRHAAETFANAPFGARIAVVSCDDFGLARLGYEITKPAGAEPLQSASIAAGVAAARRHSPEAVMIALGDMPFVPVDHLIRLVAAFAGDRIASTAGAAPTPPAIFSARWFDRLAALSGDAGGRTLLEGAPTVRAALSALIDIDTPEQLRSADTAAAPVAPGPPTGDDA